MFGVQKKELKQGVESLAELVGFGLADAETELAGIVEGLAEDAGLHVLNNAHDVVHLWIGERKDYLLLHLTGLDGGMGNGVDGCLAVGNDESAGAEVYAAIVAHDDDEYVGELVGIDLSEDGLASR